jgi:hypothetical protein
MHYRFVTLAIPHRHGDPRPGEVDYVTPLARGEIQLNESDELRPFCLVRGAMPDGDLLIGMSWPHADPTIRAHEILPYNQLARAWTHAPVVETAADGAIHLWVDLIHDLVDIVEPENDEREEHITSAFVEAFRRRLGLCFTPTADHDHPRARGCGEDVWPL